MTLTPRLLIAALALSAATLAQAQTSLLNVSYDVAREFYKDINTAFAAHYKRPPAKTSRSISHTPARARRRGRWPMGWRPMW